MLLLRQSNNQNGHKNRYQMYKCHACGKQFRGGNRINYDLFWQEYLYNKQTYQEISNRYGVSASTVKRKIATIIEECHPVIPQKVVFLLIDQYCPK